jgi:DNA-binding transcriptional regulator of glucitol operon
MGKGVLGVGQRRGLFSFGELLVLVYNAHEKKVVTVQSLRGFSIFSRFKEISDYTGLTLEELRRRNARPRSALIQAVEAVEKRLRQEKAGAA